VSAVSFILVGKTGKTDKSKADRTSKTGNSDSDDSDTGSPSRPLSMKSKNKSVRFSTLGNSRVKTDLQGSDIDERNRSLDLIPEESLSIEKKQRNRVHPIFIEKQRLDLELEKYTAKTTDDCHEDIMDVLECHDPQKFRKKARGVLVVPFAMKDFYYRISKDEVGRRDKKSKLTAAQIKIKVEEMRQRREQEKFIREKQAEKARKRMEEDQNRKLERLRRQKMNTESKQRDAYYENHYAGEDDDIMNHSDGHHNQQSYNGASPKKDSYRVRKNISKGLDPEEGKNTKVTLELLQKLHYKDIEQSLPDDFNPEKFVTDPEDD